MRGAVLDLSDEPCLLPLVLLIQVNTNVQKFYVSQLLRALHHYTERDVDFGSQDE
jgi:hypothetical protein